MKDAPAAGDAPIVVVGAGGVDLLAKPIGSWRRGEKQEARLERGVGGSGVNVAMRLLSAGHAVLPVLSIAADEGGRHIRAELLEASRAVATPGQVERWLGDPAFFGPSARTPWSIVISESDTRTILSEAAVGGAGGFAQWAAERLGMLGEFLERSPGAVIVGHIPGDAARYGAPLEETTTWKVIARYSGECPILVNPGRSQLARGDAFWSRAWRSASVFQVSLSDLALANRSGRPSLTETLARFHEAGTAAVVTLGQLGAVAVKPDQDQVYVVGSLLDPSSVVDATGAGDAFSAGLAAFLAEAGPDLELAEGLRQATLWASHACTTLGAATDCPCASDLRAFAAVQGEASVRTGDFSSSVVALDALDREHWSGGLVRHGA